MDGAHSLPLTQRRHGTAVYADRMYRRWTSAYQFKWTPILTYTRRHLSLLEWFEKNLEPVAFVENPGRVGVALVVEDLKVTVRRAGMQLESGLSGASVTHLLDAVEGIFQVLEPRDAVLVHTRSTSTVSLSDVDYHEMCAQFGRKMGTTAAIDGGFRAVDGSALLDLHSDQVRAQVEWGIVDADELLFRLTHPDVGRIGAQSGTADSNGRVGELLKGELPAVSTLVDVAATRVLGGEVSDPSSVESAIAIADTQAQDMSESLARDFVQKVGE